MSPRTRSFASTETRPPAAPVTVTRLADRTDMAVRSLDDMAGWYAANSIPATFREVDPVVLRVASRLCGGDYRRCVRESSTSVVVHNRIVWT